MNDTGRPAQAETPAAPADPIPTPDVASERPLSDIPFTMRRRLNWGDSDTAEIGYASAFVNFAIEAIEVWWEAVLGTNWYALKRRGMGAPTVGLYIDYHAPMVAGDRMDVAVLLERLGRSSLALRFEGRHTDGRLSFSGVLTEALVENVNSDAIRAVPFPDDWRRRIEGYARECALRTEGVRTRREVLDFWFGAPGTPERGQHRMMWFAKQAGDGSNLDALIRERFAATHEAAVAGALDHWQETPDGALALCILLDQFPRNMFRGSARAFASDEQARAAATAAIARGFDRDMPPVPAIFLYLPFEHSEDLADQRRCVELFGRWAGTETGDTLLKYARDHLGIIERFGRFPHRNAALGRTSTPEEEAYLSDPEAGF
ncbi:MAG TPA: DUF924 family protein [Alphaproteobacteria bacterium]|jgi:uncharacterized protein (DUF924 family)/acyl-CoA thioesterase FadM|nr:DUF924 family protein [Alphaproteobacteria bacterium]